MSSRPDRRRGGFSLLEVLFASFLLVTSVALTVFLINSGFRSEADSEVKVLALHEAENVMAEIQAAAMDDFHGNMASVDGKVWPAASSDLVIESRVNWSVLPVPCSELESQYADGISLPSLGRKELTQSVWKVSVRVKAAGTGDTLVALTTLLTDLKPEAFDLRMLAPDGTTAPAEGELRFRAVAYDAGNDVIEDLILTWYVEPINSFGSIHTVRRDGWECIYKNIYLDYGNRYASTPGLCRIVCRAEYKGHVRYAVKEITNQ